MAEVARSQSLEICATVAGTTCSVRRGASLTKSGKGETIKIFTEEFTSAMSVSSATKSLFTFYFSE
jgi:hypothetical protein